MSSVQRAARVGEEYVVPHRTESHNYTDHLTGCGSEFLSYVCSLEDSELTRERRTRVDKVPAELVTLTYGTMVAQLCKDFDSDYMEVNRQLEKMGYNIGMRLIEDFLAKSNILECKNFRETADAIAKVGSSRLFSFG